MRIYDGRESFYQWDLNQKITSDEFVAGDKIHFFNMRQTNALVVKAYELDGQIVADVPNILLQTALPIKAWRYVYDEHSAQTVQEFSFKVEQRPQPYDYFYTETELYELRKEVDEIAKEATDAVGQLQEGLDNAKQALKNANDALTKATNAEQISSENELLRVNGEVLRMNNEESRILGENDRIENEKERVQSESDRQDSENTRIENEKNRVLAEDTREENEDERVYEEELRKTAEENRVNAEKNRAVAEAVRVENAQLHSDNENERVAAERIRQTNEDSRLSSETARQEAEEQRIANEEVRQANFKSLPNNIGNAVKGSASGEVVRVDDVSPIEHTTKVKVNGKNFFYEKSDKDVTTHGITSTFQANKSEFVVTGTADIECSIGVPSAIFLPAGTYTVSVQGLNIRSEGNDRIFLRNVKTADVIINSIYSNTPKTFTLDKDVEIKIYIVFREGSSFDDTTVSIQIEEGDTATEYEPYIEPSSVKVTRCGKNLFDKSTDQWVESTKQSGYFEVPIRVGIGKTVAVSYSQALETGLGFYTGIANSVGESIDKWLYHSSNDYLITKSLIFVAETEFIYLRTTSISTGTFFDKIGNDLLIEISDTVTDYEPYKGETFTPSADGTVEISSVAPTMTLVTDNPKVTIDLEYNQDTNKAMENVKTDIRTLDNDMAMLKKLSGKVENGVFILNYEVTDL